MVEMKQIDDCWNRIGVWAKNGSSCPKLVEAIHCRNCDIYGTAGRVILDRTLPPEERQQLADHYARPVEHVKQQGASFTLFRIGEEWLALPTRAIHGIVPTVRSRRIPHRSHPAFCGLANFSGDLELVVSLAALIGIEPLDDTTGGRQQTSRAIPRMLRISSEKGSFAFAVDEVSGTCRHLEDQLGPVSSTLEKAIHRYVCGTINLEDRCVGVLDLDLVTYSVEQSMK